MEGYELDKKDGAAKVVLRGRILKSGNVQLYLYSCINGGVTRKAVGTIVPELSQRQRAENMEAVRLARARAGLANADAIRRGHGFAPNLKSRVLFVDYVSELMRRNTGKDGSLNSAGVLYRAMMLHFEDFSGGRRVEVGEIGRDMLVGFNTYLKTAKTVRKLKDGERELSQRTRRQMLTMFIAAINKARRDGLTDFMPSGVLDRYERPKVEPGGREYLTAEEVRALAATECKNKELGRAFLFCCFSGLRYSDVRRLTWGDVGCDANGVFVRMRMQKTSDLLTAYLPETAKRIIGYGEGNHQAGDKVFELTGEGNTTGRILQKWADAAGVQKHVTFHVSRHTCATLLLNLGAPIEVVQRQLGHRNIVTTQIYAKLLNRSISEQIDKFDTLGINI